MMIFRLASALLLAGLLGCAPAQEAEPAPAVDGVARDVYGNPDLNGVWQAMNSAHWDLEARAARAGPIVELGALGGIPAGRSVLVGGGAIPYTPDALAQRDANRADSLARDPAIKCFLPGIPRATYMPFPFQIVQGENTIMILYEFASASRVVYLDKPDFEHPFEAWMEPFPWSLRRRHARHRRHQPRRRHLVRRVRQLPQRCATCRGTFHESE